MIKCGKNANMGAGTYASFLEQCMSNVFAVEISTLLRKRYLYAPVGLNTDVK